ncbi:hypothetical protein [Pseudokineococcus sp. 1T1Z-3]|uniref:hypothetical protein n=1 Tax=Pseudokineococcus sp. 1T1Z-3 TaxID=3132745 RepID=UPI003094F785
MHPSLLRPLVVGLPLLVLPGCASSVPTLGTGNGPEAVVATYLAAVQVGDDGTARSLSTPEHAGAGLAGGSTPTITDLVIAPAEDRSTDEDGATGRTVAAGHDAATDVTCTFVLDGGDESMPDGPTTWSFLLVRDDGGPWLVADEGAA